MDDRSSVRDHRTVDDHVADVEGALVDYWSRLGRWPEGGLVDDRGALRYETPVPKVPYNGVIRSHLEGDPDAVVTDTLGSFAARSVECMWVVHPSARPADLGDRLRRHGLALVERVTGMSLDVGPSAGDELAADDGGVRYRAVDDDRSRSAYEDLIMAYWEIAEEHRDVVARLNAYWGPEQGVHRFLGWDGDRAIAKGFVIADGERAGIYGMSVLPEARGRGVASALTRRLVEHARSLGCSRVVLHSSEMAAGVYARAGFVARCTLDVYATAPLWSGRH